MEAKINKKVESPEQLNQYIKLANPGVWFILIAIVVLLVGVCVWGIYGRIDTKVSSVVVADNSGTYCYIKEDDIAKVKKGMKLEVNNDTYKITFISKSPEKIDSSFNEYAMELGNLSYDEWVYKCQLSSTLPNGVYSGEVIIESISPSKFIVN